jgi:hypothetical protein
MPLTMQGLVSTVYGRNLECSCGLGIGEPALKQKPADFGSKTWIASGFDQVHSDSFDCCRRSGGFRLQFSAGVPRDLFSLGHLYAPPGLASGWTT